MSIDRLHKLRAGQLEGFTKRAFLGAEAFAALLFPLLRYNDYNREEAGSDFMDTKEELSIKETIYSSVLEGIFSCEYKPGQVLNEKELMVRYHCSKSPVREALVSLCNDNVLRNIPRYGYEILRLTREDVEDMIQFRYLLEGGMLKTCIRLITPVQLEKLRRLNEESMAATDVWRHWENNANFHLQLIAFSRNECAYHELKRILDRLKRAYAQFYWSKWDASVTPLDTKNHAVIIESLEAKDTGKFLDALKNDLKDFGNICCDICEVF